LRRPWVISNAVYDPENLIVHLNATKKTRREAAHTYRLDFGRYSPPAPTRHRQLNADPKFSIDLNHDLTAILSTVIGNIILTCTAGTKGQLIVAGHIESAWFKIAAFTVTAQPGG
jgi:hypothetical protein